MSRLGYRVIPPTPDVTEENIFEALEKTHGEKIIIMERLLNTLEVLIKLLQRIQVDIDESYDKSRKAKVAGSVVSILGAGVSILGFALIPVTLGGSIVLAVGGGAAAAAGGLTTAGADIGYYVVSKTKMKDVDHLLKVDEEEREKLRECGEEYERLIKVFSDTAPENLRTQLKNFFKRNGEAPKIVIASSRGVYYSFKIVDVGIDGFKAARTAIATAKAIKTGTGATWAVLRTGVTAMKLFGVAFDIASIPIDGLVLAKALYDIYKYRTRDPETNEPRSNSNRANKVKEYIKVLQENEKEVKEELACLRSPQNYSPTTDDFEQ